MIEKPSNKSNKMKYKAHSLKSLIAIDHLS
jgi:hypothetical protein